MMSVLSGYKCGAGSGVFLPGGPGPVMIGNELAREPVDWEAPGGGIGMLRPGCAGAGLN